MCARQSQHIGGVEAEIGVLRGDADRRDGPIALGDQNARTGETAVGRESAQQRLGRKIRAAEIDRGARDETVHAPEQRSRGAELKRRAEAGRFGRGRVQLAVGEIDGKGFDRNTAGGRNHIAVFEAEKIVGVAAKFDFADVAVLCALAEARDVEVALQREIV